VSAAGCDGRIDSKEYDFGVVVISAIGEYCGRLFFPMEAFTAIKNTLIVKELDSETSYFTYFGLKIWKLERRGAAQPFLSKGDTEKMEIIIPVRSILNNFREFANTVFQKIRSNNSQIETLSTLRDTLLPKLMNGDIRLS
jgi:type I restriction enzyme S subunit